MQRKRDTLADHGAQAQATRFAWWASFFATLALVAALGIAKSAQALTVPAAAGTNVAALPATEDEEDEAEASEDEEGEAGECEEDEDAEGECETEEEGTASSEAPAECLLSTVEATVMASANQDKVRLSVRYATSEPSAVAVAYGLHGSKGSLFLGADKKHFGRKGVLHLTRRLSEEQMAKVLAAKGFTVRLRVLDAPGYCTSFFDRQLDVRRATPSGLAWQQSE